eukprot:GFKZ01011300.1.p1 GENE.GFKZ01011300.1~~GFKZ01011300.1.p1  ORF type:complete len:419 (-),score=79.45 GFKZ01011300.1:473-1729(-)
MPALKQTSSSSSNPSFQSTSHARVVHDKVDMRHLRGYTSWWDSDSWVESASNLALCLANLIVGFGLGYVYALQRKAKDEPRVNDTQAPDEQPDAVQRDISVQHDTNPEDEQRVEERSSGDIRIAGLYVYPIKACAGMPVDSARVTDRGLENDRLFMVVDFTGRSITQKKYPKLALVKPRVEGDTLVIEAPGMDTFEHVVKKWGTKKEVTHMMDACEAIDQGDAAGAFFDEFLGVSELRLVRMREGFRRKVDERYVKPDTFETSFSDGWPYLLANEESLKEVGRRAGRELEIWRFRPNVVVGGGCLPFEEDGWKRLAMGDKVEFEVANPCIRCKVVTVDPKTGEMDAANEPTETLKKFRSFGKKVVFGQNMVPTKNARGKAVIKVGDSVRITETLDTVPMPNVVEEGGKGKGEVEGGAS